MQSSQRLLLAFDLSRLCSRAILQAKRDIYTHRVDSSRRRRRRILIKSFVVLYIRPQIMSISRFPRRRCCCICVCIWIYWIYFIFFLSNSWDTFTRGSNLAVNRNLYFIILSNGLFISISSTIIYTLFRKHCVSRLRFFSLFQSCTILTGQ